MVDTKNDQIRWFSCAFNFDPDPYNILYHAGCVLHEQLHKDPQYETSPVLSVKEILILVLCNFYFLVQCLLSWVKATFSLVKFEFSQRKSSVYIGCWIPIPVG